VAFYEKCGYVRAGVEMSLKFAEQKWLSRLPPSKL
jgi:hypothetical protein